MIPRAQALRIIHQNCPVKASYPKTITETIIGQLLGDICCSKCGHLLVMSADIRSLYGYVGFGEIMTGYEGEYSTEIIIAEWIK